MSARALAIVIGRAGSRGLPGKNAIPLAGRPMVCRAIEAALAAASVGRVVVSTDGEEIAAAARSMGTPVIDRPRDLATDTATVADVVRHAIEAAGGDEPVIVVLYANVPVRPAGLIDEAVQLLAATGADSVQSYSAVGKMHPHWMVALDAAGRVRPFVESTIDRRQDLPRLFAPDGGVIAVTRAAALAPGPGAPPHAFLGADRRGLETEPGSVVDVDGPADLALAEAILAGRDGAPPPPFVVGGRAIAPGAPPYVIAELGVNHDGALARALDLVAAARRAGADAVKVQWFEARRLMGRAARLAAYQLGRGAADAHGLLEGLELSARDLAQVAGRARALGLHAIATVFSAEHAAPAAAHFDALKVASPDVVNRPLLEAIMATGRPLLVSTGASDLDEVGQVTAWLGGHPHLLLHCVSAYPAPDDSAALAGRLAMGRISPRALGYSDHTSAIDTGALAVASGACVLEKHLTWDRAAAGPDHAASLDPESFARYVAAAHRAWRMLGPQRKEVLPIEIEVRDVSRQSLTATSALPPGHVLRAADLTVKRPGSGIAPARLDETVGRRLARAVEADMPLREEDLQ
jgi:N-acetylneuraminate synthase/N,N'-diacetyllegionaminate synthase